MESNAHMYKARNMGAIDGDEPNVSQARYKKLSLEGDEIPG